MIINIWLQIFAKSFTYICILLIILITLLILQIYCRLPIKNRINKVAFNYITRTCKTSYSYFKLLRVKILRCLPKWTTLQLLLFKQSKKLLLFVTIWYKQGWKFIANNQETMITWGYTILHFLLNRLNKIIIILNSTKKLLSSWPVFINWCKNYIPKMGGAAERLTATERIHNTMLREMWLIFFIAIFIYIYHYWLNELPVVIG